MISAVYLFYFFALLTVVSAFVVLLTKNVIHAVLALLGVFLGVAALYIFAGADFIAVSQLIVYVGGVLVLMLFGVMLTNKEIGKNFPVSRTNSLLIGVCIALIIFTGLLYLFLNNDAFIKTTAVNTPVNTISFIGIALIREYNIAFELIGFLLLIALIGAAFVAGQRKIIK
jgi:NADH-quinone oxidoreductase subunit J